VTKQASSFVDYQQRAAEFAVGDVVSPLNAASSVYLRGRVVAVWPGIGMIDVEWPDGNMRCPVEDVQRHAAGGEVVPPEVGHDNVPGGAAKVPVSDGPAHLKAAFTETTQRVARAYVEKACHTRKALYWGAIDRHYRASTAEASAGSYNCPNCKGSCLRPASYKRQGGVSEKLLACSQCLFLIKRADIIGHPEYVEDHGVDVVASQTGDELPFTRTRTTEVN